MANLNTQQIGKCGELLVQYELLKHGIESAPLTTDYGIDLVAFCVNDYKPITLQVKTCTYSDERDKWVEWQIHDACPADYVCLVDLERDKFWILNFKEEFLAISKKSGDNHRLWWSIPGYESTSSSHKEEYFRKYESQIIIPFLFLTPPL